MDPVETLNPVKDTTLGLIAAAQARGWQAACLTPADLWVADGDACGRGRPLRVDLAAEPWRVLGAPQTLRLSEFDAILMRKDPPVDAAYLYACHVLALAGAPTVNDVGALRVAHEKLFAQRFADLQPPTLIDAEPARIRDFVRRHGRAVIKPLDGMGGASVFALDDGDMNREVIIETMTRNGRRPVVVQQLIEGYARGDKRILLIDGEPVPRALLRTPPPGALRANLAAGGRGAATELSAADRKICARVGPEMRRLGLLFVGLDVIDGLLTEINVTSPTCMRELDAECGLDIGGLFMDALERRLQST